MSYAWKYSGPIFDAHTHIGGLDDLKKMLEIERQFGIEAQLSIVHDTKNMHAETLDKPVALGYPVSENELKGIDVTFRWDTGQYKSKAEVLMVLSRIGELRILGGFKPEMVNDL